MAKLSRSNASRIFNAKTARERNAMSGAIKEPPYRLSSNPGIDTITFQDLDDPTITQVVKLEDDFKFYTTRNRNQLIISRIGYQDEKAIYIYNARGFDNVMDITLGEIRGANNKVISFTKIAGVK